MVMYHTLSLLLVDQTKVILAMLLVKSTINVKLVPLKDEKESKK